MTHVPKLRISEQEYRQLYWPQISMFLQQTLASPDRVIFAREEFYRQVYNVCVARLTLLIYDDLVAYIKEYLENDRVVLLHTPDMIFLPTVAEYYQRLKAATDIVAAGFRYLEKTYTLPELNLSIQQIFDNHIKAIVFGDETMRLRLSFLIRQTPVPPPFNDPSVFMHLAQALYRIDPSFVSLNPALFAMYVPGLGIAASSAFPLKTNPLTVRPRADSATKPRPKRKCDD
eukprot:TRINITY_DN17381_c0_g1_i1.p1 TRINITY_DN17381_c0_g1~~TRINITY_DN17381_c0_g1_i1.p1  ORF type:complete len:230 (+),score=41.37 TRINITY_DN17381_c0_g1_i1:275-964(+)